MNNETLREHLFATLNGLRDETMDINRAKAVVEVGKVLVDTAKIEVEMAKVLVQSTANKEWANDEVIATPAFFNETKRLI